MFCEPLGFSAKPHLTSGQVKHNASKSAELLRDRDVSIMGAGAIYGFIEVECRANSVSCGLSQVQADAGQRVVAFCGPCTATRLAGLLVLLGVFWPLDASEFAEFVEPRPLHLQASCPGSPSKT